MLKAYLFLLYFLAGLGHNTPGEVGYVSGIGPVDLLVVGTSLVVIFVDREGYQAVLSGLRPIWSLVLVMACLGAVSYVVNILVWGALFKDMFEFFKYVHLAQFMVLTAYLRRYGRVVVVAGFISGVLASGVIAVMNPMNADVLGTPQMFNPNVIGNILASSIVLCSCLLFDRKVGLGLVLAGGLCVLSVFTFSKGTWLMMLLALLGAVLLGALTVQAPTRMQRLATGLGVALALSGLVYAVVEYWDVLSLLVTAKLDATRFGETAAEGSSFSARVGLLWSGIRMSFFNPLLGVGISNYEQVNVYMRESLGNLFYADDNPNSAFVYVLCGMGWPAFFCFVALYRSFLSLVRTCARQQARRPGLYVASVGAVFLVGGLVQVEMLTAYYFWFACGVFASQVAMCPGTPSGELCPSRSA